MRLLSRFDSFLLGHVTTIDHESWPRLEPTPQCSFVDVGLGVSTYSYCTRCCQLVARGACCALSAAPGAFSHRCQVPV